MRLQDDRVFAKGPAWQDNFAATSITSAKVAPVVSLVDEIGVTLQGCESYFFTDANRWFPSFMKALGFCAVFGPSWHVLAEQGVIFETNVFSWTSNRRKFSAEMAVDAYLGSQDLPFEQLGETEIGAVFAPLGFKVERSWEFANEVGVDLVSPQAKLCIYHDPTRDEWQNQQAIKKKLGQDGYVSISVQTETREALQSAVSSLTERFEGIPTYFGVTKLGEI